MSDISDLINSWKHVLIAGDTGAGKSVLGKQIHAESDADYSVFWNPMKLDVKGRKAESPQEMLKLMLAGHDRIHIHPHWASSEQRDEFQGYISILFQLSEQLTDTKIQIVTDEAHNLAPSQGSDTEALHRLVKEGRNFDLRSVAITQSAKRLHNEIIERSALNCWIGKTNSFEQDYYSKYGMPIEEMDKNGPHTALLMDKQMEPIGRFKADSKYV